MTKIGWWYNSPANCCLSLILQRSCCCRFFFFLADFFFLFFRSFFLSFFLDASSNNDRERERVLPASPQYLCFCLSRHIFQQHLSLSYHPSILSFTLVWTVCVYRQSGGERERTSFLLCRCISYQQDGSSTWLFHVRDLDKLFFSSIL